MDGYEGYKSVKSFVISHEYGHHIDYVTSGVRFKAWSQLNKDFKDAIQKDKRKFKGYERVVDFDLDTRKDITDWTINDTDALQRIFDDLAVKYEVVLRKGNYQYTRNLPELKGDGFGEVRRWSEICHHFVNLKSVDLRVIPTATIGGFFTATLPKNCDQILIVSGATAACQVVQSLIILNPESDIPGLPICPTVVSLCGHVVSFD